VLFESDTQKRQFDTVLNSFKTFIYNRMGFHPHIIIEVNQATDASPKYYTPQDKLKRLMELNPALRRFQKDWGSDSDYD
jgi:hypothetical protein